jgi:hypothetical protein
MLRNSWDGNCIRRSAASIADTHRSPGNGARGVGEAAKAKAGSSISMAAKPSRTE